MASVSDPVPAPGMTPVTEPGTDSGMGHISDPVIDPGMAPVTEPYTDPDMAPITDPVAVLAWPMSQTLSQILA